MSNQLQLKGHTIRERLRGEDHPEPESTVSVYTPANNLFQTRILNGSTEKEIASKGELVDQIYPGQDVVRTNLSDEQRRDIRSIGGIQKRDSLVNYLSHAFAPGTKTNFVFGCILGVNLIVSILNTFLLSIVVKSLQTNQLDFHLGGEYLLLADKEFGTLLEVPAVLSRDKSMFVGTLEHHANTDASWLTITNADSNGQEILMSSGVTSETNGPQQPNDESDKRRRRRRQATLGRVAKKEMDKEWKKSNYISLRVYSSGQPKEYASHYHLVDAQDDQEQDHKLRATGQGVEIVTKSLVLDLLDPTSMMAGSSKETNDSTYNRAAASGEPTTKSHLGPPTLSATFLAKHRHQYQSMSIVSSSSSPPSPSVAKAAATQRPAASRRLLEFDGEQQSITLPLLSKFNLLSSNNPTDGQLHRAAAAQQAVPVAGGGQALPEEISSEHYSRPSLLVVNGQLNCGQELSGTLGQHFDVQSRVGGNLSCRGESKLRIVSKLAGVNLFGTKRLLLEAPQVSFDAPKTNKFHVLDGIKLYENFDDDVDEAALIDMPAPGASSNEDGENGTQAQQTRKSGSADRDEPTSGDNLRAFNLMLLGGFLMASQDREAAGAFEGSQ